MPPGCATAARPRARGAPSTSDGSGRGAGSSPARCGQAGWPRPACHSSSSSSSNSTQASATRCACRCCSPRSSDGTSSRTADRQLGSKKTIRAPAAASGYSASALAAARSRASSSSPCEISGRPQQTFGASADADARRVEHVRGRHADCGIVVVRERVVEDSTGGDASRPRPSPSARRRGRRASNCRANVSRAHAGGVRRRSRPSICSLTQRPGALRAIQLDSGARRLPQRASSWTWPSDARAQRRAVPLPVVGEELALEARDVDADRTLGLARAAFEAQSRAPRTRLRRRGRPRRAGRPSPAAARWRARASSAASSRVAMYDGHIVPSSVLRHAPTPLHISTAPPKPAVLGVVEERVGPRRAISRAVAEVAPSAAARRRSCRG